jgi:chromosome partitioning protein
MALSAELGRRVLCLDLDPQASLTFYLGNDETELEDRAATLYHVISGATAIQDIIIRSQFDLVPSSIAMAKAETELHSEPNGSLILKELVSPLRGHYDVILLDCPPSLGMLTVNALNAADSVLIPVKTQLLSLVGLTQILDTISKVRRRANPELKVEGILPTMHQTRAAHDAEVLNGIREHYGDLTVFEPIPSRTNLARVAGAEAGKSFLGGAGDLYRGLAEHIVRHG